jgi:hypothetical protein
LAKKCNHNKKHVIELVIIFIYVSNFSVDQIDPSEIKVIRADETIFWELKAGHLQVTKTLFYDFFKSTANLKK